MASTRSGNSGNKGTNITMVSTKNMETTNEIISRKMFSLFLVDFVFDKSILIFLSGYSINVGEF